MIFDLNPNQVTLIGAFGGAAFGAVIGGIVSFLVARYMIKHSVNYSGQIDVINEALTSLATTQEELKQHYAQSILDDKMRQAENERRIEANRWRPQVTIESKIEGMEQVNYLILKDRVNFYLEEVSLVSQSGAKIYEYPAPIGMSTTGFRVLITHASLNLITSNNPQFFQTETFDGGIRYRAKREHDGVEYTGDIKFHGQRVILHNTCFYKLSG